MLKQALGARTLKISSTFITLPPLVFICVQLCVHYDFIIITSEAIKYESGSLCVCQIISAEVYLIIHPSIHPYVVSSVCRMTGVARGPCRGSGPPSSRPEWCAQSQNMSCTSIYCAVCLSCRVETLKAAFSTASLAWNGKRQKQILLFLAESVNFPSAH